MDHFKFFFFFLMWAMPFINLKADYAVRRRLLYYFHWALALDRGPQSGRGFI